MACLQPLGAVGPARSPAGLVRRAVGAPAPVPAAHGDQAWQAAPPALAVSACAVLASRRSARRRRGRRWSISLRAEGNVLPEAASLHADLAGDIARRFGSVPLPSPEGIESVVQRIETGARKYVAPSARTIPFGSSVNGFGEASSDLDVVINVDTEDLVYFMSYCDWHKREQRHLANQRQMILEGRKLKGQQLFKVSVREATSCAVQQLSEILPQLGFEIVQSLPRARRPLVTLRDPDGIVEGCDLSVNNHLPLCNSRLLLGYSQIDGRVRTLVLLVKSWAKGKGVCGADQGNLSSYTWTIMVIYYFQLLEILPSFQKLAKEKKHVQDIDYWGFQREFDMSFLPVEEYQADREAQGLSGPEKPEMSLATILHGFFHFYTREYRWGDEVVSIKDPVRRSADAWWRLYGKPHPEPGIHVEDPIELRDLNIVLRRDRLAELKLQLQSGLEQLEQGCSLEDFMEALPPSSAAASGPSASATRPLPQPKRRAWGGRSRTQAMMRE